MSSTLRLIFIGLFSYRAARLLTVDDGPNDVFDRLRTHMGVRDHIDDDRPHWKGNTRPKSQYGRIFDCPYCMGCYVAPLAYAVFSTPHPVLDKVLIAGAVTGMQSALQSLEA